MRNAVVRLERLTRNEFREALKAGHFKVAILATGSIEQHLEHLAMEQDIASSTYVAERVAERLYPKVVVAVPLSIGISEHHMPFAGTISAKPGSWLAVLFDAVESMVRSGVKKVLILNGHGGNARSIESAIQQWKYYFANTQSAKARVELRFCNYWDLIPQDFAEEVLDTGRYPGHAGEFETSFTMHASPENVRPEAISLNEDAEAATATSTKGRLLVERAIAGVAGVVDEMLTSLS